MEQVQFGVDVFDCLVRDHFQVGRWQHHHGPPYGSARGARHTDESRFLDAFALATQTANRASGLGVGDHPSQLRTHCHQERFFALIELATLALLNDQDTHHAAVVDDRGAQEGGEALLAGLGEVPVARVRGGIFEVKGFFAGAYQPDQAFVGGHADLADRALVQPFGGHQHEPVGFRVQQVDRADLAGHGLFDTQDNDPQRRLEIFGGVYFLDDLAQRIEHGSGSNSVVSRASEDAVLALSGRADRPRA